MSQDLKEFYFPEDYGYVVNVDGKTKEQIGLALHSVKKTRRELIQIINEKCDSLENSIGSLYSMNTNKNESDVDVPFYKREQ